MATIVENVNKGQRSKSISRREQSIDKKLASSNDDVQATHYAKQLVNLFPNNRLLLEELLDDLLVFADADSHMTSGKVKFLKNVSLALNFNEQFFKAVLRKHILTTNPNPFTLLDVAKNVSYVDLKKKSRLAVKDWHPDKFS